jgi:hypothetical protein
MNNKRLMAKIAAKKEALSKARYEYCFALLDAAIEILIDVNKKLDDCTASHEAAMKEK